MVRKKHNNRSNDETFTRYALQGFIVLSRPNIHPLVVRVASLMCCVSLPGNYVKDLSHLGRRMEDILIIDNSPFSYMFQPDNAIACLAFETSVALYGGGHQMIERLTEKHQLVAPSGEPLRIISIRHAEREDMYRLEYQHGKHTVTPNHQVTLRWSLNPRVRIDQNQGSQSLLLSWRDPTRPGHSTWLRLPFADLPLESTSADAASFGHWFLHQLHGAGHIHMLKRGDLFEVTTADLVNFRMDNNEFASAAVIPLADSVLESIIPSVSDELDASIELLSGNQSSKLGTVEEENQVLEKEFEATLAPGVIASFIARYTSNSNACVDGVSSLSSAISHAQEFSKQHESCSEYSQVASNSSAESTERTTTFNYVKLEVGHNTDYVYMVSHQRRQIHARSEREIKNSINHCKSNLNLCVCLCLSALLFLSVAQSVEFSFDPRTPEPGVRMVECRYRSRQGVNPHQSTSSNREHSRGCHRRIA